MDFEYIDEHGVTVKLNSLLRSLTNFRKRCKLGSSRALALICLSSLNKQIYGQIAALDISGALGLAGTQWIKHLGSDIRVMISSTKDLKEHVESCLKENNCLVDNVKVVVEDPYVVMHSGKYMFVYAEVCGSAVTYFDGMFRNVNHNGLVCVTSTDTSVLQNKSPATARRLYGANIWKTEYSSELALRVIIGNMARAAARWNKGIKVELCLGLEHGLTVVCRVMKGSKFGEKSLSYLQYLAHCQLCQARKLLPEKTYICDRPSETKICECNADGLSAPVLMLGPMWGGSIYNYEFLFDIFYEANRFGIAQCHRKLLKMLIVESVCCSSEDLENDILKEIDNISTGNSVVEKDRQDPPPEKRCKLENTIPKDQGENSNHVIKKDDYSKDYCNTRYTIKCALNASTDVTCPTFFFDIQHHSVKGGNPPSILSVIKELHKLGHKASKTHFGPRCVRTSATRKMFVNALQTIWDNTKK